MVAAGVVDVDVDAAAAVVVDVTTFAVERAGDTSDAVAVTAGRRVIVGTMESRLNSRDNVYL